MYTQSKTILASSEHSVVPDTLIDCGIKEIISKKDDDNSELLAPPYVIAEAKQSKLDVSNEKNAALPKVSSAVLKSFSSDSPTDGKKFLSFEISRVQPR